MTQEIFDKNGIFPGGRTRSNVQQIVNNKEVNKKPNENKTANQQSRRRLGASRP